MKLPKNAFLGTAGLILVSTSILFIFFIILPGATHSVPFRRTYFLRADTNGITGARPISQWTYFYVCGLDNDNCGDAHAAIPFGYAWDSNAQNIPPGLGGGHGHHTTSYHYYYMWRFGWVFLMMTLFFEVLAFFTAFISCFGRLGAALAFITSVTALFWYTLAAPLITATFVQARNRFHDAGRTASIGAYAYGFLWGSYGALIIAVILFAMGMRGNGNGHIGRRRSTRRSSRSFDGRRVKDDYS